MKLLKASFLLAAAAIAPSIARADIIDIAPSTGGYMMYGSDQIWASADGTALIGNAYMSNNYVFWSQATGRLTGIADALTVPNATSYRLDGLNARGPDDGLIATSNGIISSSVELGPSGI